MSWTCWLFMGVTALAFWALVVFAVVALFRGSGTASSGVTDDHDPRQILDQRFARGEIDADQYHALQDVLRSTRSWATSRPR